MRDRQSAGRDLDVVVYGATGFVGRLVAEYLAKHATDRARIGLGGRSRERLAAVREKLGPVAMDWPLIVADARDVESVAALAARTHLVATTVGPYVRYGLPLVEACARAGTDYADLAGEVLFVRSSIDQFHDTAVASGARIVHACGFDSIPSDLGVYALFARARADGEGELTNTTLVLKSVKGGFSGGTVDSMRAQIDAVRADSSLRSTVTDPYGLSPDREAEPDLGNERDTISIARYGDRDGWVAPFVMAPFNTRIVRRSNALQNWAYGRQLRYREVVSFGSGPAAPVLAGAMTVGLAALTPAMSFPPSRALLDWVLPDPGDGPGQHTQRRGHFRVDIHTRTTTGARYVAVVAAKGDPGYAATSVMLAESVLCLATEGDQLPDRTGVLTPATAMDGALIDRLRHAGFLLSVDRV